MDNRISHSRALKWVLVVSLAALLHGQETAISIMVGPTSSQLTASQTEQYKAFLSGTQDMRISWSISPTLGAISASGLYTAPPSIPAGTSVTLTATSLADPTKSASAVITLSPDVAVSVGPNAVSLTDGQTQQFTSTVTGGSQTGVSWTLSPQLGTVTNGGLYSAPAKVATPQNVMLTATSLADSTKTAIAVIALTVTQTIAPVVLSMTSPADGSQVSGNVGISATASGSIANVQFYVDSAPLGALLTAPPYTANWDSLSVADGAHSLSVMAQNTAGTRTTSTISVSVKNAKAVTQVTFPVEVMGPSGTTATVQLNVPAVPAGAQRLWLQIHGLKYQSEASVQVNNSAWLSINDTAVTLLGLASQYGGIGGGFATMKLTMNLSAGTVVSGSNTVRFRFNGTDGVVSGYRILDVNFVGPDGRAMVDSSSFVQDNPATWQAPLTQASDISAGKSLWYTAPLTTTGGPIRARCTDCHAQDGRDLKYFNYSNNSIRVRSMFHGLTQQQGDQIASYIRSLNAPAPATARPWNPPYQPGPGLDSAPVQNWAAGAGLGAVLDHDVDMLNYMAPGGNTSSWAATGNLNVRETPIAMPLPDWNSWLPHTHPLDGWDTLFTASTSNAAYKRLRNNLIVGNAQAYVKNAQDFDWLRDNTFLLQYELPSANPVWTAQFTDRVYSFPLWVMVKSWELNQEFQLEGLVQAVHGPTSEPRSWVYGPAFVTSPNMQHIPVGSPGLHNGAVATWHYLAFAWYHEQLILNYSNYHDSGRPIDWGYVFASIGTGLSKNDNGPQASLMLFWMVKGLQASEFDPSMEAGVLGWNPDINWGTILADPNYIQIWGEYSRSQRIIASEGYMQNWLTKIKTFTPQQFYQGGFAKPTETAIPDFGGTLGSKLTFLIPQLGYYGVNNTLLSQVADWGKTVWPLGNWDAAKSATCGPTDWYVTCSNAPRP